MKILRNSNANIFFARFFLFDKISVRSAKEEKILKIWFSHKKIFFNRHLILLRTLQVSLKLWSQVWWWRKISRKKKYFFKLQLRDFSIFLLLNLLTLNSRSIFNLTLYKKYQIIFFLTKKKLDIKLSDITYRFCMQTWKNK